MVGVDSPCPPPQDDVVAAKAERRRELRGARRALVAGQRPGDREAQGAALGAAALTWMRRYAVRSPGPTGAGGAGRMPGAGLDGRNVLAYSAMATEPPTGPLLAALRRAGVGVWLPVLAPDRELRWRRAGADDEQDSPEHHPLRPTRAEVAGATPVPGLPPLAAVFVPALAVSRDGWRLGQGGGYYDRVLPGLDCPFVAVLHDHELVEQLPAEPHDIPMHAVLTTHGVTDL